MQIPHGALVVVADGQKALFLRNAGDAAYPNLDVIGKEQQDNPPNREQAAGPPGRMFDGPSDAGMSPAHRSAVQETDWHALEKQRFASDMSDLLYKLAHGNQLEKLIIVAPPQTLGELRQHYHKEVQDRLIGELDKDLTNHPVEEIERILSGS